MYCVKCGVKLADTEKVCPLCNTPVYIPEIADSDERPLYPKHKMPKTPRRSRTLNGAVAVAFLVPLLICFLSDLQSPDGLDWFGYVAGALAVAYVTFALPLWFSKPNPVIFTPCVFAAATLYVLYIDLAVGGGWFLGFAFPVAGFSCAVTSAAVALLYYLKKGKLYVIGGALLATGAFMLFLEFLICVNFHRTFVGWSYYPLGILALFGGFVLYLAVNKTAREIMERKLFF